MIFWRSLSSLLAILLSPCRLPVYSQTMGDTDTLITSLLTGYKKMVRPSLSQTEPVYVNMTVDLVAILGLDEVKEELSIAAIVNMAWWEPRMLWDPELHAGLYTVNIPQAGLWKPNIIVSNPTRKSAGTIGKDWHSIRLDYDGTATWSTTDIYYVTCPVDVTYYPFDIQTCAIIFMAWDSFSNEIYLDPTVNEMQMNSFQENGEWIVRSTYAGTYESDLYSFFVVSIEIERRPTYFLVNVILPIMFMGFLNILVFLLPAESGERMSYAITVLLSIAVLLTLVSDNMPKTSNPMSVLCFLIVSELIVSALVCLATIVSLKIFFKDNKEVPHWLASIVQRVTCSSPPHRTYVQDATVPQEAVAPEQLHGIHTIQRQSQPQMAWTDTIATDSHIATYEVTWRDVSRLLDKIFGLLCLLWLVGGISVYSIMVSTRNSADNLLRVPKVYQFTT